MAGAAISTATRADLDLTDADACAKAVERHDVVVNAAAWTAVDDAESARGRGLRGQRHGRGQPGPGLRPGRGPARARLDRLRLRRHRHDAVRRDAPCRRRPRPTAAPRPPASGRPQALCADTLIVRTAWLYGAHGRCFPRTIAAALATSGRPSMSSTDQVGQPTWTRDVAELVRELLAARAPAGTYHATSSGQTSWHGFARAVAESVGADPARVHETTSARVRATGRAPGVLGPGPSHPRARGGRPDRAVGRALGRGRVDRAGRPLAGRPASGRAASRPSR